MKQRILIVDDDRLVADTLSRIFEVNGFLADARYSAATGMERARSFGPELVLCDVTMPEENGFVLAARLHREMPATRVLMFTACADSAVEVDEHVKHMGHPLRLLRKPCRPEDLLRECHALLKTA